jgi:hypothetical protein
MTCGHKLIMRRHFGMAAISPTSRDNFSEGWAEEGAPLRDARRRAPSHVRLVRP